MHPTLDHRLLQIRHAELLDRAAAERLHRALRPTPRAARRIRRLLAGLATPTAVPPVEHRPVILAE